MQLDGPWLVPSTSQSGKKAMKNKSRRHLHSRFSSAVRYCLAAERLNRARLIG
jgi:hypothetical protein